MINKLGIIVPYRNRPAHLEKFKIAITEYLKDKDMRYEVFIIDQDNGKQFNRGMLLNIGFTYALKAKCNYVAFHDVDMLPIDVDYSYTDVPLHLSTNFKLDNGEKHREIFDEYFGGVTLFPVETFKLINGYSNKYWAWGYEDDDLLLRCKEHQVELDTLPLRNMGKRGKNIRFNGFDTYVTGKNVFDFSCDATFFISFYPDKLTLDHTKESDDFTIFSIPGWDFAVCFNSFSRYNFCTFDTSHNALFVNSKIKTNYRTNITVTYNHEEKVITVYQDGLIIGSTQPFRKLYFYRKEPNFYLGAANPNREEKQNYFKGYFDEFAYFDKLLDQKEISDISLNKYNLLNEDFYDYKSSSNLKTYYNANHIDNYQLKDLSGNGNDGKIYKCEIVKSTFSEFKDVKIPHRRQGVFKSIIHEENGFVDNRWKDQATRWNQLRFFNEVCVNKNLLYNDGLSDLEFIEHGIITDKKIKQISVGL